MPPLRERVQDAGALRRERGQPREESVEGGAHLAVHADHRRHEGEARRLVYVLGHLAALRLQDVGVGAAPLGEGQHARGGQAAGRRCVQQGAAAGLNL